MRPFALAMVCSAVLGCADRDAVTLRRIEIVPGARIGDRDGPGLVGSRFRNVACSQGAYYYSDLLRHDIAVFDPAGTFLRTIGRAGGGPGEFRQPVPLLVDADTLYAFDRPNGRYTVISARDSIVRIVPFTNVGAENPYAIALLADRRVVVNGLRRDTDSNSLLPAGRWARFRSLERGCDTIHCGNTGRALGRHSGAAT